VNAHLKVAVNFVEFTENCSNKMLSYIRRKPCCIAQREVPAKTLTAFLKMIKHVVIDGYNLAHKLNLKITKGTLQQVRDKVQHLVSKYATRKKCNATIVFDGKWVLENVVQNDYVEVVFSTSGENADTRIKRIIDETPNKSSLCVVSSDNEILNYAKVSRAKTMISEDFIAELNAKPDNPSMPTGNDDQKPDNLDLGDLDRWKKLFE
jgi:predicted RNA-binding protein with PIN domain